jgi:hypothetical protein
MGRPRSGVEVVEVEARPAVKGGAGDARSQLLGVEAIFGEPDEAVNGNRMEAVVEDPSELGEALVLAERQILRLLVHGTPSLASTTMKV